LLKQPSLGKADRFVASDHEMIERPDINERKRLLESTG
jgi:hypothetical protein